MNSYHCVLLAPLPSPHFEQSSKITFSPPTQTKSTWNTPSLWMPRHNTIFHLKLMVTNSARVNFTCTALAPIQCLHWQVKTLKSSQDFQGPAVGQKGQGGNDTCWDFAVAEECNQLNLDFRDWLTSICHLQAVCPWAGDLGFLSLFVRDTSTVQGDAYMIGSSMSVVIFQWFLLCVFLSAARQIRRHHHISHIGLNQWPIISSVQVFNGSSSLLWTWELNKSRILQTASVS